MIMMTDDELFDDNIYTLHLHILASIPKPKFIDKDFEIRSTVV